jgi:hypothetical protein
MEFFSSMQNAVFNVIAPLQSPGAQLELAVANGNQQEVQRLCQEVDPTKTVSSSNQTMLMVACSNGQADMYKYLRSMYQWDIMLIHTATGDSLLHMASRAGSLELVQLLIGDGLLASHRNARRQNPYDVASDKVGQIKQFLLPHVFEGEKKDGSAPKLPHWLEETRSRGAPGYVPEYNGPPPPTSAPPPQPGQGHGQLPQGGPGTDLPYRLPTSYDGFGTSETRQSGRPMAPTGPPPPTAVMGPRGSTQPSPAYGQQVLGGPSPHLRRAYVPFNSSTGGVGPAYTAAQPVQTSAVHQGGPTYSNAPPGSRSMPGRNGALMPKLFTPQAQVPVVQMQQHQHQQQQQQHHQQQPQFQQQQPQYQPQQRF